MQDFEIKRDASVSDDELSNLLRVVYIESGYTSQEVANEIFKPDLVRKRGCMFVARNITENQVAGMMILVPHESDASFLSKPHECEFHLLGVLPKYRSKGIGKLLVTTALDDALERAYHKINLTTQSGMKSAHKLYESLGFKRNACRDYSRNNRDFLVYERMLHT